MTTKRFILMLLVMLGSVAGAWAELVTFNYYFSYHKFSDSDGPLCTYIENNLVEQSNSNVKVTLSNWNYNITSSHPNKVNPDRIDCAGYASAKSLVVTCLQPSTSYIQTVTINGTPYAFPEGETEHTFVLSTTNYVVLQSITVAYQIIHTHNPAAEWSYDANQHWHACTETLGTCDADGKLDIANHTYGSSMYGEDASVYYACAVCGYVDNTRKAQYDALDFLSMRALDAPMTIGMTKTGSPADYDLQYSLDRTHWTTVALTATNSNIVEIPAGQTCYFRHGSATAIDKISSNQSNHWSFTMTGDGTIEADGNIVSLIDATCQKETLAGSPQHVFTALFKGCERLTVAPALPFPATGEFNYMYMFEGTGISVAPQLPATTAVAGVYMGMFKDCKKLETVPILPATTVGRRGYQEMFYGCEKLKTLEITNITTVTSSADGAFTNWLTGTAADTDGKLIAPLDGICNTKIPAECIPSNWQWATTLKANEDPDNDGNFYTTFYDSRYDYLVAEGHKAYSSSIEQNDGENELHLTATPDNIIPKGDGVIIHGGSGEVLLTVSDGSATKVAGNVLTGSDTDTTAPDFCYILSYGEQRLGFYKYGEGKALSAHKAYLTYEPVPGVLAKALRMVFVDDEVDGIESISCDSANSPTGIYSVSGMRLDKLQKGINIVNGKKIIVK